MDEVRKAMLEMGRGLQALEKKKRWSSPREIRAGQRYHSRHRRQVRSHSQPARARPCWLHHENHGSRHRREHHRLEQGNQANRCFHHAVQLHLQSPAYTLLASWPERKGHHGRQHDRRSRARPACGQELETLERTHLHNHIRPFWTRKRRLDGTDVFYHLKSRGHWRLQDGREITRRNSSPRARAEDDQVGDDASQDEAGTDDDESISLPPKRTNTRSGGQQTPDGVQNDA